MFSFFWKFYEAIALKGGQYHQIYFESTFQFSCFPPWIIASPPIEEQTNFCGSLGSLPSSMRTISIFVRHDDFALVYLQWCHQNLKEYRMRTFLCVFAVQGTCSRRIFNIYKFMMPKGLSALGDKTGIVPTKSKDKFCRDKFLSCRRCPCSNFQSGEILSTP